ncbi:MAG: radical SAM protein [Asgard group archaeon]|nr:radical SAM protein [Asgard group archaeon]
MLTKISKRMMTKSFKKTKYQFMPTPETNFVNNLGIYIHVPFCYTKCSFCPFYKEIYSDKMKEQYVEALIQEISSSNIQGESKWIYFGGGTPNTLSIEDFSRIVQSLKNKIAINNMGVELLPSLVTDEYLIGLKELGFSKISIGIETFSQEVIKKTGRKESNYQHISKIISKAKQLGFHVAVDLMVGLPKQTSKTFFDDISKIIQIKPDQITIYPFMVIRGVKAIPSCSSKEQFTLIEKVAKDLLSAGYDRKSVWIFVLSGTDVNNVYDSSKDELVCDYCGFGPASFSTYDNWKVVKPELSIWIDNIQKGKSFSLVAPKTKGTDDWRKFANKIYDLKIKNDYKFPFHIRLFDFILRLTGFYRNGYLTDKGRYFSHEITKAVVESLPFPIQNSDCVINYDEYQRYKNRILKEHD